MMFVYNYFGFTKCTIARISKYMIIGSGLYWELIISTSIFFTKYAGSLTTVKDLINIFLSKEHR